jgi:hypothetical protein
LSFIFFLLFMSGLLFLFRKSRFNGHFGVSKGEAGENLVRRYIEKLAEMEGY